MKERNKSRGISREKGKERSAGAKDEGQGNCRNRGGAYSSTKKIGVKKERTREKKFRFGLFHDVGKKEIDVATGGSCPDAHQEGRGFATLRKKGKKRKKKKVQ